MMLKKNLRLIVLVCTLLTVVCANAQVHYSAVLQHGDNATAFYGDSALIKAEAAAQSGDAIYLSEGTFKPTTITKAIKLYGAGEYTKITGTFVINVPNTVSGLHLEGLFFPYNFDLKGGSDITIKRCTFQQVYTLDDAKIQKLHFIQNKITKGGFSAAPINELIIENSVLLNIAWGSSSRTVEKIPYIKNSYIQTNSLRFANISNCIVKEQNTSANTNEISYTNCVLGFTPYEANNVQNCTEMTATEVDALFKDKNTMELTDEAAAKYLGDDQTQVGMYGGQNPFTIIPSTPVITRASHPSTPTADGKLPFEITVELRD